MDEYKRAERESVAKAMYHRHVESTQYYDEVSGPPWHGLSDKLREHWMAMADVAIVRRVAGPLDEHATEAAALYRCVVDLMSLPDIYSVESIRIALRTLDARLLNDGSLFEHQRELAEAIVAYLKGCTHHEGELAPA